jgi:hypothetical protein
MSRYTYSHSGSWAAHLLIRGEVGMIIAFFYNDEDRKWVEWNSLYKGDMKREKLK